MPNTEADFPLNMEQVKALLRLVFDTYQKQAHLCYDAQAPLAGCVMAGAAVEAILTTVICLLIDKARQTGKTPKKDLLDWTFFELLDVAKQAKWLPEELTLEAKLDFRAVKTPVQSDTIRKVRNLVHPARYLKERTGEYTLEELRTLYATCHAAYSCLEMTVRDFLSSKATGQPWRSV